MNLQSLYVSNYSNHPAFVISREPLRVDSEGIAKFNSAFGSSRSLINNSTINELDILLASIFGQLLSQQLDVYERAFIQELQSQILEYLDGEFSFRKKLKEPKVHDSNSRALQDNAFFYSQLSDTARIRILEISEPQVRIFRERARSGMLKRTDLSINDGKIVKQISKLVDEEFRSQGIFESVSNYVGIKYTHTGLSLELSVAGSTWWKNSIQGVTPPRTMYAHLDESIYAPKAIVYLTDVSENNGPTSSYPRIYDSLQNNSLQDIIGRIVGNIGNNPESILFDYYKKSYHQSMGSPKFREHFMLLPESLRFNSHFGWDILAGSLLEGVIADSEEVLLGNSGKFVVFDGSRLLHRGGLIEDGERLVLQVVFWPRVPLMKRASGKFKQLCRKIGLGR